MSELHKHPCPRCGWNWPCTCADPDRHHGFCFECAPQAEAEKLRSLGLHPGLAKSDAVARA